MFKIGDNVVYPMHGAGTIEAIEKKEMLGNSEDYYIIKMPLRRNEAYGSNRES